MTHIEDREDDELLYDLGAREHPSFFFLDAQGEVLARHDADDVTVKAFEETGARVKRSLDLRKKADAGDTAAKIDLAIVQGELGVIELSDVETAIEGATLTPEQERALGVLRADATASDLIQVLKKNRDDAARKMVAEEFLKLYGKGTHPARLMNRRFYWTVLAGQSVQKRDAAMVKDAIAGLRVVAGPEPSPKDAQQIKELEEGLKALEELKELEAAK
jgi:hypothetical protein